MRLGRLESREEDMEEEEEEQEVDEEQEVGFMTPPSSPGGSCGSGSTMATCEGGGQVYVLGNRPTQV